MNWIKVRVVRQLQPGFGRDVVDVNSSAWVARKGDRVLVYTDLGRINDLSVADAAESLEYVRSAGDGHYILHRHSDEVEAWYRHAWNKSMY